MAEVALLREDSTVPAVAVAPRRRLAHRQRGRGSARWSRSVRHLLIARRLEAAKDLLARTDEPIKAIAARLGFHDAAHFCRQFRRRLGETPRAYRRRAQPPGSS